MKGAEDCLKNSVFQYRMSAGFHLVCVEKQLLFIYFDDAVDGERLFILEYLKL